MYIIPKTKLGYVVFETNYNWERLSYLRQQRLAFHFCYLLHLIELNSSGSWIGSRWSCLTPAHFYFQSEYNYISKIPLEGENCYIFTCFINFYIIYD